MSYTAGGGGYYAQQQYNGNQGYNGATHGYNSGYNNGYQQQYTQYQAAPAAQYHYQQGVGTVGATQYNGTHGNQYNNTVAATQYNATPGSSYQQPQYNTAVSGGGGSYNTAGGSYDTYGQQYKPTYDLPPSIHTDPSFHNSQYIHTNKRKKTNYTGAASRTFPVSSGTHHKRSSEGFVPNQTKNIPPAVVSRLALAKSKLEIDPNSHQAQNELAEAMSAYHAFAQQKESDSYANAQHQMETTG